MRSESLQARGHADCRASFHSLRTLAFSLSEQRNHRILLSRRMIWTILLFYLGFRSLTRCSKWWWFSLYLSKERFGRFAEFLNSVGLMFSSALRTSWPLIFKDYFCHILSLSSIPESPVTHKLDFFLGVRHVSYTLFFHFLWFLCFSLYIFCWPVFELIYPIFCCVQCAVKTIWWILHFKDFIFQF